MAQSMLEALQEFRDAVNALATEISKAFRGLMERVGFPVKHKLTLREWLETERLANRLMANNARRSGDPTTVFDAKIELCDQALGYVDGRY